MTKIILPSRITREFIQLHPNWIFLYGSDYLGKSFFGAAYSAHGEPNAYPIPTIWKLCPSSGEKFMDDGLYPFFKMLIDERIDDIPLGQEPILPFPKIGEGHSQMKTRSPKLFNYMKERINAIAYPNIEIDWNGLVYSRPTH